tara:strand:+ start:608 stop:1219 length:612 start_codon:yes stop_codon:yes gene_type:complete
MQNHDYVRNNPEEHLPPRIRAGLSSTQAHWDQYAMACKAYDQWKRDGGHMKLYCPAIVEIDGFLQLVGDRTYHDEATVTAFFDYDRVHNGTTNNPVNEFNFDSYALMSRFDWEPAQEVNMVETKQSEIMNEFLSNQSFVRISVDALRGKPELQQEIAQTTTNLYEGITSQNFADDTGRQIYEMVGKVRAVIKEAVEADGGHWP